MKKKVLIIFVILIIFLILAIACICNKDLFLNKENESNKIQNDTKYENVESNFSENLEENQTVENNDDKYLEKSSKYNNDDLVGFIKIDGTNINEPVFKGKDNDYYLTHNGYKEYDKLGAIYLDYRFSFENSKKKIIFGHNFVNANTPFKTLEKYYDKDFYENHKYIYLENDKVNQKYEIFSVYVETSNWDYMQEPSNNKDTWYEELKKMKDNSLYDTNVDVNENDEILILQTCSTLQKYQKYQDKYLLIVAKKID